MINMLYGSALVWAAQIVVLQLGATVAELACIPIIISLCRCGWILLSG
jgi:hypothetical protein